MGFIMKFFIAVILLSSFALAQKSEISEIQNTGIVCKNSGIDIQVEIDANKGKIWLKKQSSAANMGVLVRGAVFSGIHAGDRYMGEVVGEVTYNDTRSYITIIMRNVKDKPQMELFLHPLVNQMDYSRILMNDCEIRN